MSSSMPNFAACVVLVLVGCTSSNSTNETNTAVGSDAIKTVAMHPSETNSRGGTILGPVAAVGGLALIVAGVTYMQQKKPTEEPANEEALLPDDQQIYRLQIW